MTDSQPVVEVVDQTGSLKWPYLYLPCNFPQLQEGLE